MEKAIKRAIEGGFSRSNMGEYLIKLPEYAKNQIWNDPQFWKALARAEKWYFCTTHTVGGQETRCEEIEHDEWVKKWHDFINHLAKDGTPEEFFNNLLK